MRQVGKGIRKFLFKVCVKGAIRHNDSFTESSRFPCRGSCQRMINAVLMAVMLTKGRDTTKGLEGNERVIVFEPEVKLPLSDLKHAKIVVAIAGSAGELRLSLELDRNESRVRHVPEMHVDKFHFCICSKPALHMMHEVLLPNELFRVTFWGIWKIHNNIFCYEFRHGCY